MVIFFKKQVTYVDVFLQMINYAILILLPKKVIQNKVVIC